EQAHADEIDHRNPRVGKSHHHHLVDIVTRLAFGDFGPGQGLGLNHADGEMQKMIDDEYQDDHAAKDHHQGSETGAIDPAAFIAYGARSAVGTGELKGGDKV